MLIETDNTRVTPADVRAALPEDVTVSFAAVGDNLIHESIYLEAAAKATVKLSVRKTALPQLQ